MSNPDLTHYANNHYDPHNLQFQDVSNSFRDLPGVTVLGNCHSGNPGTNPVVTGLEIAASGGLLERLRRMSPIDWT